MQIRSRLTAVVIAALPLVGASADDLSLIPWPQSLTKGEGSFHLSAATPIVCTKTNDGPCAFAAGRFAEWLARAGGPKMSAVRSAAGPSILFRRTDAPAGEGYRLTVTPSGVEIDAASDAGLLYGAATLFQLATQRPAADIPAAVIEDAPRFAWRGLLLDSVRHFQPPAAVKSLIDTMAWHKLNVLHWHLADDQGWRIEIAKYPRLTQIGAFRSNAREKRYGGFYTKAEIRDIVAYAKARAITIVPEIEMPGHALGALAAYPQFASVAKVPGQPSGDWGVFPYLYNVDDSTFAFLEDVLTEVMELFPSPYIHIGGDEAPKDQWDASPKIQARMRALGVKDTKALQGYFTDRIGKFLEAHGRRLIGWDEILEGRPSQSAVVMSWRSVEGAGEAAGLGHDVVLSPAPTYYLDFCQATRDGEPTCRGPQTSLKDVYALDPEPKGALEKHLLGVQANIWTEHLRAPDAVFYAAFPRAAALAETGWSKTKDWNSFVARLPAQLDRYRTMGIAHSTAAFAVDIAATPTATGARVSLSNQAAGPIAYTLDGSAPASASPRYTAPFDVKLPLTLRAVALAGDASIGSVETKTLDRTSILRRTSWDMDQCSNGLPLGQKLPGGRVAMVNVMHPCWIYRGADLDTFKALDIAVAKLPFNFQLMHDIKNIPLDPKAPAGGALRLRRDSCTGPVIADVPLPKTHGTLHIALPPLSGVHDLCFEFARRKPDPVWAIDWVQPVLKE